MYQIERALKLLERVVDVLGPILTVVLIIGLAYVYFKYFHVHLKNGGIVLFGDAGKKTSEPSQVGGGNGKSTLIPDNGFSDAIYKMHIETCKERFGRIDGRLNDGDKRFAKQNEAIVETHEDVAVIRALMGHPRPPKRGVST